MRGLVHEKNQKKPSWDPDLVSDGDEVTHKQRKLWRARLAPPVFFLHGCIAFSRIRTRPVAYVSSAVPEHDRQFDNICQIQKHVKLLV